MGTSKLTLSVSTAYATDGLRTGDTYNIQSSRLNFLDTVAVLTIVTSAPATGSFRPGYAGTDKTIHNISEFDSARLLNIAGTTVATSSYATYNAAISMPQIQLGGDGAQQCFLRPITNMGGAGNANYQANFAAHVLAAVTKINLPDTAANKLQTAYYVIQAGIDTYCAKKTELATFNPYGGGEFPGDKFLILYTGYLLNNQDMKDFIAYYQATNSYGWYEQVNVRNGLWGSGGGVTELAHWRFITDVVSNSHNWDPYRQIDGSINDTANGYDGYQNTIFNTLQYPLTFIRYMPSIQQYWSDYDSLNTYILRMISHGIKTLPDTCAPAVRSYPSSITLGNPTAIHKTAHGVQNGDEVRFNYFVGVDAALLNTTGLSSFIATVGGDPDTFTVALNSTGKDISIPTVAKTGYFTSTPESGDYFVYDTNATWTRAQFNMYDLFITSGTANGKVYKIGYVFAPDAPWKPSSLELYQSTAYADGVRSGDTYEIWAKAHYVAGYGRTYGPLSGGPANCTGVGTPTLGCTGAGTGAVCITGSGRFPAWDGVLKDPPSQYEQAIIEEMYNLYTEPATGNQTFGNTTASGAGRTMGSTSASGAGITVQ